MITYVEEQVKDIAKAILKADVNITPVGNHELSRHLVYHITNKENLSLVFKIYFKKNRWNREVASLRLLSKSNVKCPKLINYGVLHDGTEWLMTEFIQGLPFEKVKDSIPKEDWKPVITQMGEELAKIHSLKTFDFFGNWDENGNSLLFYTDFKAAFIRSAEIVINQLLGLDLPEKNLHIKGCQRLRDQYDIISSVKEACLCHNDFDSRNVLVRKSYSGWELMGVIDFEQSFPWDRDKDMINLYYTLCSNSIANENSFFSGYMKHHPISSSFFEKKDFYLLFNSLSICSWSYVPAPLHYRQGVELLQKLLSQ